MKLFASSKRVGSSVIGKLVHGIKWYYVTTMDEEAAVKLKPGGNAKLRFSKTYSAELNMKVESVGQEQNGKCVVVFSSTKYLQDVTALREMMAEIVFDSETGIRVPQEAVHVDENGKTFVYILEGLRASAVHVDITDENGDYYMVAESKNGLRTGDRIIVKANNLYDGAVVAD